MNSKIEYIGFAKNAIFNVNLGAMDKLKINV